MTDYVGRGPTNGTREDAISYAQRRAQRENAVMYVYYAAGAFYVRSNVEGAPDGAVTIGASTNRGVWMDKLAAPADGAYDDIKTPGYE